MKKVLFSATVDSHILHFHIPYLKMFKDKGYEVHVATNGDEKIPYCDVKHKISFERSPLKINNLKAIKQLKKVIEEEKFDIIHCHTPMGSVVTRLAAKSFRKKFGTRVIYTAHGFHFYKGAPILNWMMFYPVEKYLSKFTDDLILINNEDYELALKKFKAKKTHYVPGVGVDPEKFNFELSEEERHNLRNSIGLKDDDIVLIYVAELNKNKNQKMAIEAMQELVKENSKYKLLLVGKDSHNGRYQQMVKDMGLSENVIFAGYRNDVAKLMKISNISISTSLREGLPVNLIEASMCDLPIVATNCRGNRDIKQINDYTYLVDLNDCNGLITSIKKCCINNLDFKKINTINCELNTVTKKMDYIYFGSEIIRVLHIIGSMNMGGAENFIMNLYRNIDREKVQFDFISHKKGIFDQEIEEMGGKIYYLNYINKIGPFVYKKKLNEFFKRHPEYNILHTHVDQTSGIILDVARKYDFKLLISHSHSTSNSNNFVTNIYKKYLQTKINKYANIKFACSKKAGKWLYRDKCFTVINNGIDIDKYKYDDKNRCEIRKELKIPENAFVLGHVGRFNEVKNHGMIIDVFYEYNKKNSNSYLLLVGDGELKDKITDKVNKLQISDNVKFLGIRKDVNKIYSAMDCFLFPSLYEGFPVTLVEAQINGLNLIISENITREVDISGNIKFLNISDISKWIEVIEMLNNRSNISNNQSVQSFDIKKIVCDYIKIIEGEKM